MDDGASLALVLPPPVHRGCASLRQAKERTHGGVQEEENKMRDGGGTERRVKVHWL